MSLVKDLAWKESWVSNQRAKAVSLVHSIAATASMPID